ncbi:IclR family transcriptional regulator domain-containing protein [Streptomyces katsurahamanus]|uniref:Helix-turn-helix domain-containing protein n=1 Tax=Streptomyces katsurahamanus TaxID=2577098 RepID=A0ABW9P2X7_9ACTN|nr:IclR family transcriptional regulator C-terminal domain-containing protein [Streptomyces katsurahamanus]MQS39731.1 helix-turn-helix domain-containing protein [Streptomyces katsurahamanus]
MGRLADEDSAARRRRRLPGAANTADFSEALARGLSVLAVFNGERRRLTQADLARELGLSRATVRRAVLTLEHLGYLVADGRTYGLSPGVLRLADAYLTSNPVSAVTQPVCERIRTRVDEACSVAVLDGADAVVVARAVPRRLAAVGSGIGYRTPAAVSSLGRVLLAHLPPGERAACLGTEAAASLDHDALDRVREDGYAYVAHDIEAGAHSIAVPLHRWDDRVTAALHVGCSLERISPQAMHDEVLPLLREAAGELRGQLI